ncbi:MAG: hypothetical protein IJH94_02930 [Clostridia bacterium]|nr:hypothetical protein [Clostridia bacterium]
MAAVEQPRHIARDFYIGNTHIQIATDYCEDKTPEDVNRILKRIARNASRSLAAAGRI